MNTNFNGQKGKTKTVSWHPTATKVIPNNYVGSLLTRYEKQVVHTTETKKYTPSEDSYYGHQLWPHATLAEINSVWTLFQHLPLNRSSACMRNLVGGVETNRDGCIQIEIAWIAADGQNLPTGALDKLREWLLWVSQMTQIPYIFVDNFHYYPPENNHQLGKEPWRLRGATWDNFKGILGHQHADENVHGDPGKINVAYLQAGSSFPTTGVKMSTVDSCVVNGKAHEVHIGINNNEIFYREGTVASVQTAQAITLGGQAKSIQINPVGADGVLVTAHGMDNQIWYRYKDLMTGNWLNWSKSQGVLLGT